MVIMLNNEMYMFFKKKNDVMNKSNWSLIKGKHMELLTEFSTSSHETGAPCNRGEIYHCRSHVPQRYGWYRHTGQSREGNI